MQQTKVDIKIGEATYAITTPFQLGQLRVFQPAFTQFGGLFISTDRFDALVTALVAALSRDYPHMTKEEILKLEVTPTELRDASDEFALASGMFKKAAFDVIKAKREKEEGEVMASIGATSTEN